MPQKAYLLLKKLVFFSDSFVGEQVEIAMMPYFFSISKVMLVAKWYLMGVN